MIKKDAHQTNMSQYYEQLLSQLTDIRARINLIASDLPSEKQLIVSICRDCLNIHPEIQKYIEGLPKNIVSFSAKIEKESLSDPQVLVLDKRIPITLYIWQLFNFVCINSECFPKQLASLVIPLLKIEINFTYVHSLNSFKNASIFVHNWLTQILKEGKKHFYWNTVLEAISLMLQNYFEKDDKKSIQHLSSSLTPKTQEHKLAELQWISFIFMKLFNKESTQVKESSLLNQIIQMTENSHKKKVLYNWLHMLGNYLQNMIDTRVTTELVAGYESPIKDIKEMYQNESKNIPIVTLSIHDLQFITREFSKRMIQYTGIVRQYLQLRLENKEDYVDLDEKWSENADITTEIGHILNCILFLGGYNKKLQDIITEMMLQRENTIFEYLQLSYLLYRNIQSTRYKSKVHMITQMEIQAKSKLFKALKLEIQLQKIDVRELKLQKMLAPGQLVFLLRLLTNLVHINHRSQIPFQNEPKYLHMVMSLTHDSVSQATMKQWAIMFIRNVSQWSEKMRQEIGKIKLEMKVQ